MGSRTKPLGSCGKLLLLRHKLYRGCVLSRLAARLVTAESSRVKLPALLLYAFFFFLSTYQFVCIYIPFVSTTMNLESCQTHKVNLHLEFLRVQYVHTSSSWIVLQNDSLHQIRVRHLLTQRAVLANPCKYEGVTNHTTYWPDVLFLRPRHTASCQLCVKDSTNVLIF